MVLRCYADKRGAVRLWRGAGEGFFAAAFAAKIVLFAVALGRNGRSLVDCHAADGIDSHVSPVVCGIAQLSDGVREFEWKPAA